MSQQSVIIVGGGLAGLSAAWELSQGPSLDVTLIEKNHHLGGRVYTLNVHGHEIDVGGFLIYPWYKRYHQLIDALDLSGELAHMPALHIYHTISGEAKADYQLSFRDILELFIRTLPGPLTDLDPTAPRLHAYDDLTVEGYLQSLHLPDSKVREYLDIFDTFLQGYCYGAVTEHKMAFMASTLFRNTLQGDVLATHYFKNGSKVFIDRLQEALTGRGVRFRLDCEFREARGKDLVTSQGELAADHVVFCQPPPGVTYTSFITATIAYSGEASIGQDRQWGACFNKIDHSLEFPVLSVVNLERLYGEDAAGYLNLNIKAGSVPDGQALLEGILPQLQKQFPRIEKVEVVASVEWAQAMPVVDEVFVDAVRRNQGLEDFYAAGDFMGCPSMETALMSGKRAARRLLDDLRDQAGDPA